ncbi:MAG: hypothetical protein HQ582_16640 [Planctomycetes bacterium]|nr:hypothetical protein [Planctomycetota bacterium]
MRALFTSLRPLSFGALVGLALCCTAWAQPGTPGEYQVYPLRHKSVAEVESLLSEMLADLEATTHVVADVRRNQILLQGPEKAQQIVRQLIDSVDRSPVPSVTAKPVVKAYPCPAGRLAQTADRLRLEYADRPGIRVATDAQTAQLLVLAPPEVHLEIAQTLAQRTVEPVHAKAVPRSPPVQVPEERFVLLAHSRVDRVEPQLRRLLGSRLEPLENGRPGRPHYLFLDAAGQRVELRVDRQRNGVSLAGSKSLLPQFARLIQTLDALDAPNQGQGRTVRIVPVHRADPTKVRRAVDAYRSTPGKADRLPGQTPQSNGPTGEDTSRRLRRDSSGVELVQWLAQAGAVPGTSDIEVIGASGQEGQDSGLPADSARELGEDVEIDTLPDLGVIIVRGRDRDIDEVSRIIAEIERLSAITEPVIDIYLLEHVSGEALVQILDLVAEDLAGGRQGSVHITPLVKPNALLLIGWGEALDAVKELVAKLDHPVSPETQLRVFALRRAPASSAASTLDDVFQDRGGLGPQVEVDANPRTNSLIVRAAPRDMAEVELLVNELDRSDSQAVNQACVIKLNDSLAADLAATLQDAIDAATGDGDRRSAVLELLAADVEGQRILKSGILADVEITPDPHTNTLIVSAPAESMELLKALIEQLDSPTAVAQIKVFKIINGDANSLILMLRTLLPTQTGAASPQLAGAEGEGTLVPVRFSVETRTNSIIATGSEGDLAIIESLLLRLDGEDVQQRKNIVYSLKNSPAMDVADAINDFLERQRLVQQAAPGALSPFQQIESEVVVVPEKVTNSLIISATPHFYDEILEMVDRLDEAPAQVMIQVVIAEVELNNLDEFGVELGLQDSILFDRSLLGDLVTVTETFFDPVSGLRTSQQETVIAATQLPGYDFNNQPLGNAGSEKSFARSGNVAGQALSTFALGRTSSELGYGGLVMSASSEGVSVLIRALQETRRLDVLGRPQIMTLDNQPAFIQVGKSVPRIAATRFQSNYQTNEIVLEPTGLIMGVTPRISPDGTVVMEIDAQKSELGPEAEGIPVSVVEGTVIRQPSINITLAQTTVSAASGETIVLGGLITKKNSTVHRRVPFLADIPVLGNLFRYDNESERRTELLIILTPYVIDNADEAERLKQLEAARMSWCLADVHAIHGPIGVEEDSDTSGWHGEGEVIFPDLNPRGLRSGEYVPKEVSPENLRLSMPIPDPSSDGPTMPAPSIWDPFGKRRKAAESPPPGEEQPVPKGIQLEPKTDKTSSTFESRSQPPRSSHPTYDVLPTQFFAPLSASPPVRSGEPSGSLPSEPLVYPMAGGPRHFSYD